MLRVLVHEQVLLWSARLSGGARRSSRLSWQWRSEWEEQEEPCAAQFTEVATFERPLHSQYKRQHADIVCGVEFSPDGNLLACAGVAKQVLRVFWTV